MTPGLPGVIFLRYRYMILPTPLSDVPGRRPETTRPTDIIFAIPFAILYLQPLVTFIRNLVYRGGD